MTQRSAMAMLAEGEVAPGRRKRGYDTNWADANLTGPKNKKNHMIDSVATNER
jgi:hypothetical protein